MASPKKSIPAYGSSRSTGGVFRGHAQGNTFNMADANDVWNDINSYDNKPAEKGKIYIYISDLNPPEVDTDQPLFTMTVYDINKCQTIQQVIECSSHDYSPIRCKLFIFLIGSCIPCFFIIHSMFLKNNRKRNRFIRSLRLIMMKVRKLNQIFKIDIGMWKKTKKN